MALILIDLNLSQALKLILFVFSCPASVTYIFFLFLYHLFFLYFISFFYLLRSVRRFFFFSCIKPRISRSSILRRCKSSIAIKLERRLFVGLGSRFAAKEKRRNNSKALAVVREEFDLEARSKSKLFTVRFVAG